jgi:hypothetical protein
MISTRETVRKLEHAREVGGAVVAASVAEQRLALAEQLRRQGVAMRDVTAVAKMVLRERLTSEGIEELARAAEYVQDVQRQLKATPEEMRLMLRGAVVLAGQLAGRGVTPAVMAELAARIVASDKAPGPVVPVEMAKAASVAERGVRAYLRPEEVVRVVLAPGPGLPWSEPPAVQLARVRGRRRGDELPLVRALLVWLLRNQTLLSFPDICQVTRGHRHGHSTCITQLDWVRLAWKAVPAAPWRSLYRTVGDIACELQRRCMARRHGHAKDDMEVMAGLVLEPVGDDGYGREDEAATDDDEHTSTGG